MQHRFWAVMVLMVFVAMLSLSVACGGEFWWPVSGVITGEYGEDRIDHYHAGVDIAAGTGTPIHAACKGTIAYRGWYSGYGNTIDIQHENGFVTRYGHQSAFGNYGVGAYVNRGDIVGYVGSTGDSTGPHTHFEIRQGVTFDFANTYSIPASMWQDITALTEIPQGYACNCGSYTNPPYLFGDGIDGWSAGNSATGINWTGPNDWGGSIWFDQNGNDSFIYSPTTHVIGPSAPQVLNVNLYPQSGNTAAHDMQLFWKTDAENSFTADKSTPIVLYNAQNNWTTVNLSINNSKWWAQTINQLRLDFDNTNSGTRYIINHIVLQDALWWHFDFSGNVMGWTAGNSLSTPWQITSGSWPGCLVTDQTGNDAYMWSGSISGDGYPYNFIGGVNDWIRVHVYPQSGNSSVHDMAVYWVTAGDGTWNEAKSCHVTYNALNGWADVYLPVGLNANWPTQHISQIRLDFDQANHSTRWIVDQISSEQIGSDTTAPTVPTGLTATAASGTTVNLSWTASTDSTGVNGYKIYRNATQIGTSIAPSYSDTACTAGTTYSYTVGAYDSVGNNSAGCTAVSVTTLSGDTQAPTVPANLAATAVSPTRINLSWSASTDNVAVTGYKIYRGGAYVTTVTALTYTDTGRSAGTAYSYQVSAIDARSNESAKSTAANATTPAFSNIILDNGAATLSGAWSTGSSSTDKYGADYVYASTAVTGTKTATWTPTIAYPGNYNVYVWYPIGSNRATNSPYTTAWDGGSATSAVNQQATGGQWVLIQSSKHFLAGTTGYVRLGNGTGATGKIVVADAVRFLQVSGD